MIYDYNKIVNNLDKFQFIGEGLTRKVFNIDDKVVIKKATDNYGVQSNMNEYKISSYLESIENLGYICPVYWISEDGKYLAMAHANTIQPKTSVTQVEFVDYLSNELNLDKEELENIDNIWGEGILFDYADTENGLEFMS